ncbi:MAG TPA: hypothetical protein VG841_00875 [Caulobacterales bacterium]|nr:hypothetical protein [Caulobacterales bacterium]
MSDQWVQYRPKLQIYEILDKPGGVAVEQALQRAEEALEQHRASATHAIRESVTRLEAIVRERGAPDPEQVYAQAGFVLDIAGVYMPALCRASQSLCELVHRLRALGKWDWAAVAVHVSSMRLLLEMRDGMEGAVQSVLDGLAAVVAKYPDPCPPDPPRSAPVPAAS